MRKKEEMTKKEYAEKVAELIEGATVAEVVKNGITLTGVNIPVEGCDSLCACYYIDNDYENELSPNYSAIRAKEIVKNNDEKENKELKEIVNDIISYDKVKDRLALRMYHEDSAFGYTVYKSAKEYGFDDLILVPEIRFTTDEEDGSRKSVVVSDKLAKEWGMTEDDIFAQCIENIKDDYKIRSMIDVLTDLMHGRMSEDEIEEMKAEDDSGMYVISNESQIFGATAVLFAKEKLQEIFPNGYVILPSSVHEVIAVAYPEEVSQFDEMVQEVNQTQVEPEEVLANHAYIFKK